ncbi:hypothetical protein DSM3645_03978 [Blastopirellula marina DSM 3645]|uniref:Uncharacterized protein n=1 Tax=Blastopirellula marina DSM 3645 TaxID=314230 RepID=A3ZV37_9BACT|nr:hypothetical protein DSM3645_03978 [Blastopirellula marina DSM 3645]
MQLAIDEQKKRFTIGYGLTFGKKRDASKELVKFDCASFLKNCQNPQWTEIGENTWELRADSETGKSFLVCGFDTTSDYPLKTMIMRDSSEDKQFIEIQVVAVNEPVNELLLTFPAEIEFPDTLPLLSQKEASEGNLLKKMTDMLHMMFAPMALHNQDARKALPVFGDVDWDAAELKYAEMTPALKRLAPEARAAAMK